MISISEILFVISNGLLVPVVLLLLFLLVRALVILAGLYKQWQRHKIVTGYLTDIVQNYSPDQLRSGMESMGNVKSCVTVDYLSRIVLHSDDKAYCEHELADYQVTVQRILSKYRMLIKFGPMLGLMGTLIPMGPALVGLSMGDLSTMAYNMQVAFATTVVGMAVAGVGMIGLQMDKHHYASSLNDLEFISNKITVK